MWHASHCCYLTLPLFLFHSFKEPGIGRTDGCNHSDALLSLLNTFFTAAEVFFLATAA